MRLSDLYPEGYEVFKDDIKPSDIEQGGIGDCYFLCTLSAIAEFPYRIKNRFKVMNKECGIFCVTLFINGLETPILLDDYVPVKDGHHWGLRNRDEEVWGTILEKAWAKANGSYARIIGGLTNFAQEHVLGCPATYERHQELQ